MDYPLMVPPVMKKFREMDKKEAKQYFEWFVGEVPKRLQLIRDVYEFTGGVDKQVLDYSPESLKPLWKWFLPFVKRVPVDQEQAERAREHLPEWFKKHVPLETDRLSTETLVYALDISIYFAEVFLRNHPVLKWDWIRKPKSSMYYHQPVIVMPASDLSPRRVIEVLASKASKGNNDPDALFNLYNVWLRHVPKEL